MWTTRKQQGADEQQAGLRNVALHRARVQRAELRRRRLPGRAQARPDLANVYYPTLIGSALFEQERERRGGLIDIQVRPTQDLELDFSAFRSHMEATNYNRNWMFWGSRVIGGDNRVPTSYTVSNGTLTAATWPNAGVPGRSFAKPGHDFTGM